MKLKAIAQVYLEEYQSSFRQGRGTQDNIFIIQQIIENNYNSEIYVAFINLEKDFDSVLRNNI